MDNLKREWNIKRCLGINPTLSILIPSAIVDVFFGFVLFIARHVFRCQRVTWIEKAHQVIWYIIYSPIILLVGLYELVIVLFKWKSVKIFTNRTV